MEIILSSAPEEPKLGPDTPPEVVQHIANVRTWARQVEQAIRAVVAEVEKLQSGS